MELQPIWAYRESVGCSSVSSPPRSPPPPSVRLPPSPFPSLPQEKPCFATGSFLAYPPLSSFDPNNIHFIFRRGFFNSDTCIVKITPDLVILYIKHPRFLGLEDRQFSARFPREAVRSIDWETPHLEISNWIFIAVVVLLGLLFFIWLFGAGVWASWVILGGYATVLGAFVGLFVWYYAQGYVILHFRLDDYDSSTYEVELEVEQAQVIIQAFYPFEG